MKLNINYEEIEAYAQSTLNIIESIDQNQIDIALDENSLLCADMLQESIDAMRDSVSTFKACYSQTIEQLRNSIDSLKELDSQIAGSMSSGGERGE
jgi:hypothetical protein